MAWIASLWMTGWLGVASLAASGAAPESIRLGTDMSDRMTVDVHIGSHGPYPFLLDTGAERSAIARELADDLGLGSAGTHRVLSVTGYAMTEAVTIPDFSFRGRQSAQRSDVIALARRDMGAEGIIGIDHLKDSKVVIDFVRSSMQILPSYVREPLVREDNVIVVQARSRYGQLVLANARIGDRKVDVVIDTGAQMSIANPALQRLLAGNRQLSHAMSPTTLFSVTGVSVPASLALVRQLRIETMDLTDVPVAFSDARIFKELGLQNRPALLLGMNALRSFDSVTIDFPNKRVSFALPKASQREASLPQLVESRPPSRTSGS